MPANKNAMLRYLTIDECLRNRQAKWTFEMLLQRVCEKLEEEGIPAIGPRTLQNDLQVMRGQSLGMAAPIEVRDKKYYFYSDPHYSIFDRPLKPEAYRGIWEAAQILRQFKGFEGFECLHVLLQKLDDTAREKIEGAEPVVFIEQNNHLKGLGNLEKLYEAVTKKMPVWITYKPFGKEENQGFSFSVWWLKEFNNRWFAVGKRSDRIETPTHLALDRIESCHKQPKETYAQRPPGMSPTSFYTEVVGVTIYDQRNVEEIIFRARPNGADYIATKPLHASQQALPPDAAGWPVFSITVCPNPELESALLAKGPAVEVVSPEWFRKRMASLIQETVALYKGGGTGDVFDDGGSGAK